MIFYAQSRGVSRDEAVRLIVEGFFANVYDRITLEPVRETLRAAVAAKLERDHDQAPGPRGRVAV
jgi:Fe-S cluster assembly protein SufD